MGKLPGIRMWEFEKKGIRHVQLSSSIFWRRAKGLSCWGAVGRKGAGVGASWRSWSRGIIEGGVIRGFECPNGIRVSAGVRWVLLLSGLMEIIACGRDSTHGSGGEACRRAAGPSEQSTRTTASCGEWTASGDNTKTGGWCKLFKLSYSPQPANHHRQTDVSVSPELLCQFSNRVTRGLILLVISVQSQ